MITKFQIDFILISVFLISNLAFGLWSGRNVKSIRDFALGGRNFSTVALTATLIATWIGGSEFSLIVSTTYSLGILVLFPLVGEICNLLITAYILIPRMQGYLGKISCVEVMGNVYGRNIRIITAICSIIMAATRIAIQIQIFASIFNYFMGINGVYATIISSVVVIMYSSLGGIRAVVHTDIIQLVAFGAFVPTLTLLIWNVVGNWDSIHTTISCNTMFHPKMLIDYKNQNVLEFYGIFFYCILPDISPAMFHRILLARNINQAVTAFKNTALINFFFFVTSAFIGLMLLSSNPNIDAANILPYIFDNYAYIGFRSIIIIGVIAMIMSTTDSWINSASVIFVNDICNILEIVPNNDKLKLLMVRVFSVLLGIVGLYIAISGKNILGVLMLGASYYTPIVGIPLLITILGFRSTTRAILAGIVSSVITKIIWNLYFQVLLPIGDIIPAAIANFTVVMVTHYIFREPGGWIGARDREQYNNADN